MRTLLALSLLTVLAGFLVSVLVSLPLAVAIASSRLVARAVYPLLLITQSTPIIAIAPILVVLLGTGQLSRSTITACMFITQSQAPTPAPNTNSAAPSVTASGMACSTADTVDSGTRASA